MAAVASPYREGMGSYSPLTRRVVLVRALPSHPNLVRAVSKGASEALAYAKRPEREHRESTDEAFERRANSAHSSTISTTLRGSTPVTNNGRAAEDGEALELSHCLHSLAYRQRATSELRRRRCRQHHGDPPVVCN